MKIERTKNTVKSSIWGLIEKITNIILPFIIRTVLIKKLGAEYLGLSSLFVSVLEVLSLAELGFGSAIVFSMYKPIANNDYKTVGSIINYLKKVYRIIGIIMLIIGILILPIIPDLVKSDIPSNINIYLIYLIYLGNTVSSYLIFSYKSTLLNAMQCNDIISRVNFFTSSVLRIIQIIMLIIVPNFYLYALITPIITIFNNIIISIVVNKKYSNYINNEKIDQHLKNEIKAKIFPLMSTKIAVIIVNSADTLVISRFLGLKEVAIYNNYYYILNAVMGFLIVVYNAMQAGIGNSLVVDNDKKIISDFEKLCFINTWIITVCTSCLFCLYQPFIKLWLGIDMLLPFGMVVLFCLYFYANTIQRIVVIYKDAAGIWKEDMLRCYLSCALNLFINIVTVRSLGLYGVIGSSVLANFIGLPCMGIILYKIVFKRSSKQFLITELKCFIKAIIISIICYNVCFYIQEGLIGIILKGIVCLTLSNYLLYLFYRNTDDYKKCEIWIKQKILQINLKKEISYDKNYSTMD